MLSTEKFLSVVQMAQIVSVDLIVKNKEGQILLGKRINSPAKGFFFVPGGRVFKGESLKEGALRLINWELGIFPTESKLQPRCVSEHVYPDNFADATDNLGNPITTHYICFAFDVDINTKDIDYTIFYDQHSEAVWLSEKEILDREDVHEYVKLYFTPDAYNRF